MYQSRVRYIPFLLAIIICRHAASQAAPMALPASLPPTKSGPEIACPGGFPSDLMQHNCAYLPRQRVEDWLTTSLTDQAIATSSLSALYSSAIRSPSEWPGTPYNFALRLRSSYMSGLANGTAQFILGAAIGADPRHISCAEDPRYQDKILSPVRMMKRSAAKENPLSSTELSMLFWTR